MGDEAFKEMMDAFGREHAGKQVSAAEFQAHAAKFARQPLDEFLAFWTMHLELPVFRLNSAEVVRHNGSFRVQGEIFREAGPPRIKVDVTVETAKGEQTKSIEITDQRTKFTIDSNEQPNRVVLDKYGWTSRVGNPNYSNHAFFANLDRTLIIYGTIDEEASNREAAEILQRRIVQAGSNITVPVKADRDVTEADLKRSHLLLIGRPDSNKVVARFENELPIRFGKRSLTVDTTTYANPQTSVIAAMHRPFDRRYSMVVLAGLSAESTWNVVSKLWNGGAAQVVVHLPNGKTRALVVPVREMVRDLKESPAAE